MGGGQHRTVDAQRLFVVVADQRIEQPAAARHLVPRLLCEWSGGQRIYVFPTLDMVVVMPSLIPSLDPFGQVGANYQFLSAIVDAVMD